MNRSGTIIFKGKWPDVQRQIRDRRNLEAIASLRIMGKSPFSIHPEVEERMEKPNV